MTDLNRLFALSQCARDMDAARAECLAEFRARTEGRYSDAQIAAAEKELIASLNGATREFGNRIARLLDEPQAPSLGLQ